MLQLTEVVRGTLRALGRLMMTPSSRSAMLSAADNSTTAARDGECKLLRTVVDKVSAMIAYWDADLRCRFANRAYERWFGVTPEALIGRHIRELLGPLYSLNLPFIEGALRGEPQEFEREIPDPAGGPSRHSLASYVPDVVDGVVRGFFVLVSDITTIKRAELALRESEERFRLTLDEAPIGMALVGPDGRFLRVNRTLCEIVGYGEDELTGLTFQAITHPDDLDADLELAGQLARGEIPRYRLGKRYVRKDGTTVDIMLSASVVKGPDGAPLHFIAQIEDVTDRKRANDAIQQAKERFELALEGADLGAWDWNLTTGEVVFNSRWGEMRGLRPDEIKPHVRSWLDGMHPDDRVRVNKALEDCLQGRTPTYETEHRVRTKSGDWLWILDRGKVFARDGNGKPARMVGIELDVTDRRRSESEQTFLAEVGKVLVGTLDFEGTLAQVARLSLRQLADCVVVDLVEEGDEVRRLLVVHADPTKTGLAQELERFRLDRRRPHLASAVLETKQPTLVADIGAEYIESIAQDEEHLRVLRALDPQSMIALPLPGREHMLGAILLISTSPERRYGPRDLEFAKELALRAALALDNARLYESARRATRMRDDVLAIVAHDLRNHLSTITLQTSLLRRGPPATERRSAKPVEVIERAARRMHCIIRDLLDVARLDAGRLSVEPACVGAQQIVSEAAATQQMLAASASTELQLELHDGLPDLWADRDRLLQVFENLIGNAMKFTPPGGRILVAAEPRDGEVLFSVADTGPGIPADDLPRVFDRFWQAKRPGCHGAGLGLPIVKGIVEAHGGRIWVESQPGRGSTFFFTIPSACRGEVQPRITSARRGPARWLQDAGRRR